MTNVKRVIKREDKKKEPKEKFSSEEKFVLTAVNRGSVNRLFSPDELYYWNKDSSRRTIDLNESPKIKSAIDSLMKRGMLKKGREDQAGHEIVLNRNDLVWDEN